MKENAITLSESQLKSLIAEAVKKAMNEIGETPKGQKKLGKLVKRHMDKGENEKADEVSKYARKKQKEAYGDFPGEKEFRKGNQMSDAFIKGRDKK